MRLAHVADAICLSVSMVSKIENGKITITLNTAKKINKFYNINIVPKTAKFFLEDVINEFHEPNYKKVNKNLMNKMEELEI